MFVIVCGFGTLFVYAIALFIQQIWPKTNLATMLLVAIITSGLMLLLLFTAAVRGTRDWRLRWDTRVLETQANTGFVFDPAPHRRFHHQFEFLPEVIKSGTTRVIAKGEIAGHKTQIFTYGYYAGSQSRSHTVYTTAAYQWPDLSVSPKQTLFGRTEAPLRKPIPPRSIWSEFDHHFKTKSEHTAFSKVLLTPAIVEIMLEDTQAQWHFTQGQVILTYPGLLDLDQMARVIDRMIRFWNCVPPEAEAWTS